MKEPMMPRTRGGSRDYSEAFYKSSDGRVVSVPWSNLDANATAEGRPWRTFPWYLGQRNYAGLYWSATERALVGYESRLERARLMMLDFDSDVKRIASQPFRLRAVVDGQRISRVPDYLACTGDRPLVVDVKPRRELCKPDVHKVLDLTRKVIESRGWRYEILSEPVDVEFNNVRFLAGYRRDTLFDVDRLDEVRSSARSDGAPTTIGQIVAGAQVPRQLALAGLFHLLWRQEFVVDLSRKLASSSIIREAS
jgi:hypothetical protein